MMKFSSDIFNEQIKQVLSSENIDDEQKAEKIAESVDSEIKRKLSEGIIKLFTISQGAILITIVSIILLELVLLFYGKITPDDRTITSEVMMALIGATVIQTGTAFIMLTKYAFPSASKDVESDGSS